MLGSVVVVGGTYGTVVVVGVGCAGDWGGGHSCPTPNLLHSRNRCCWQSMNLWCLPIPPHTLEMAGPHEARQSAMVDTGLASARPLAVSAPASRVTTRNCFTGLSSGMSHAHAGDWDVPH